VDLRKLPLSYSFVIRREDAGVMLQRGKTAFAKVPGSKMGSDSGKSVAEWV
jgi:hypothetical protein